MKTQDMPLGRVTFFVIPVCIGLAVVFKTFWFAVAVGAITGLIISSIKTVIDVSRVRSSMDHNPLLKLQAKVQGVDTSLEIRFIFLQGIIGAAIFAVWTAVAVGVVLILR